MSVMMGLRMATDPARFEQAVKENEEQVLAIAARAKQAGAIKHAFVEGNDGDVMVIDEWPDEASFRGFFEACGPEIGELMQSAGVSNEPQPMFWRMLDTPDVF